MRLTVLHIIPDLGSGGAERMVVDLAKFTDKNQFDVRICALYDKKGYPLEKELEELNINTYYLGKKTGPDIKIMWRLFLLLKRLKPDVIHTHLSVVRYSFLPALIHRIPKMVHTVHNQPEFEVDAIGKRVHKVAYRLGVIPVSISTQIEEKMHLIYGNIKSPLIYNGVDTRRFEGVDAQVSENLRKELDIDNHFVLLHIGRFTEQKNHKMLIIAFKKIYDSYPKAVLLLVGNGELLPQTQQLVNALGLSSRVRFLGLRTDIPELMSISDIFVLSSAWEGLPITVLEALAAGKPVVATAVGGVPELIDQGKTGYLVKSGDVDGLAEGILSIIQNSELQRSFSVNARKKAKLFDIKRIAMEYQNLYLGGKIFGDNSCII